MIINYHQPSNLGRFSLNFSKKPIFSMRPNGTFPEEAEPWTNGEKWDWRTWRQSGGEKWGGSLVFREFIYIYHHWYIPCIESSITLVILVNFQPILQVQPLRNRDL
jgi:hypothetical protein